MKRPKFGLGTVGPNLRLVIEALPTQQLTDYTSVAERFRTAYGAIRVGIKELSPGMYELLIVRDDPLKEGQMITPDNVPVANTNEVEIGIFDSGEPMIMPLSQSHSLVGGIPRAGKSVMLNTALCGIANVEDIQIVAIDCKEGVEFTDWSPRLSAFARDPSSALEVMKKVNALGKARTVNLRETGFKSQLRKGYSKDEPLVVVVIDECAELFIPEGNSKEAKELSNELITAVSKGVRLYSGAGIVFILATQKPESTVIPTIIRDNIPWRAGFRCMTPEQEVTIYGSSIRASAVHPTEITKDQKGYCVVQDAESGFAMGRAAFVSEDTIRSVAASTSHLRRNLEDLVPQMSRANDAEADA